MALPISHPHAAHQLNRQADRCSNGGLARREFGKTNDLSPLEYARSLPLCKNEALWWWLSLAAAGATVTVHEIAIITLLSRRAGTKSEICSQKACLKRTTSASFLPALVDCVF